MKEKGLSQVLIGVLLFMVITTIAFMPASVSADWKGAKFKVCSSFPPPNVAMPTYVAKLFEEEVTKRTNGKVTFKNYWGGALGTGAEQLTLIQNRAVDLTLSYGWYTPGKLPLANLEYVFPFGPTDYLIVAKVKRKLYEEFPQFRENLAKYNCMRIYNTPGSTYQINSRSPIKSLNDCKGKKCALIGRYFGRWVEPVGLAPVVAPCWERYTMLETGVIDMTLDPVDLTNTTKNFEQAPYVLSNPITVCAWNSLWMNLDAFNGLPKDVQKIFVDVGKEIEIRAGKYLVKEWEAKIFKEWKKKGLKWTTLTSEEMDRWASSVPDIPAEFAAEVTKKGYPGWDIVRRYIEICAELGHKWPRQWGVKK